MTQPNPSTAMARAIVDELVRCGVTLAVVSPGSRSAALAIAAHEHPGMSARVALDERSGGFYALGWAKATGRPAAVVSTSGTAPANYLPAVAEADMSLVPLVVVSADRPAELRGVGANQTIDQVDLYGRKVRRFFDLASPGSDLDLNDNWRSAVSEAVSHALGEGGRPGPVHLNVAFAEPTVPVSDDGRSSAGVYPHPITGREGGRPWREGRVPPAPDVPIRLSGTVRGLVIAGEGEYRREELAAAAAGIGWPTLATALSGLRGAEVVTRYHHILVSGIPTRLMPDAVVTVGSIGPSERLERLVGSASVRIRIDRWGRYLDPSRIATEVVHADPVTALERLLGEVSTDEDWARSWLEADRSVGDAIDELLDASTDITGAGVVRSIRDIDWGILVAGSSLPIREVDAHLTRAGRVLANRGASGIDGFVSTSMGVAAAGERALALSGDLSLLHDSAAFVIDELPDLVIAVLDNDGGGIFDSLPPAHFAPAYERLFVTPHGRDLAHLARLHDVGFITAGTPADLAPAMEEGLGSRGTVLVRMPVDRQIDLKQRMALDDLARSVMRSLQP